MRRAAAPRAAVSIATAGLSRPSCGWGARAQPARPGPGPRGGGGRRPWPGRLGLGQCCRCPGKSTPRGGCQCFPGRRGKGSAPGEAAVVMGPAKVKAFQ